MCVKLVCSKGGGMMDDEHTLDLKNVKKEDLRLGSGWGSFLLKTQLFPWGY